MTRIKKVKEIIIRLGTKYPNRIALNYKNSFELLVAVMLSTQAKDETVNKVTEELFNKYPTPGHVVEANRTDIEQILQKIGLWERKTKYLIGICNILKDKDEFNIDDLASLPGVGRKTINVVVGELTGKSEGIVVDTHVKRLCNRLELSFNIDPTKIEQTLLKIVPENWRVQFPHILIYHGRSICTAKNPKCNMCELKDICPYVCNI
jgi:endonuclease-3